MADAFVNFLSCNFNGITIAILIAMVIAIIVGCYEGIWYKFKQYVKTEGEGNEKFQKKYLISGAIAIVVCIATVWMVYGLMNTGGALCASVDFTTIGTQLETMVVTFIAVLTEALVLIKACNRRLDTLFLDSDVSDEDKAVAKEVVDNKATEMKFRTL